MEFLVLAVILLAFALVLALLSGDPVRWMREEWRRMRADTWCVSNEILSGPTSAEGRATALERKQRALAKRMRKKGRHLYAGKPYRPALTSPTPAATPRPPKSDRVVVPMRRAK